MKCISLTVPVPCTRQLPQVVLFSFLVFSVICKIGNLSSGRYIGMVVQKCSCVLISIHRVSSFRTNPPKVVVPHFLTPMMMTSGNLFFPALSSASCPLDQRQLQEWMKVTKMREATITAPIISLAREYSMTLQFTSLTTTNNLKVFIFTLCSHQMFIHYHYSYIFVSRVKTSILCKTVVHSFDSTVSSISNRFWTVVVQYTH